MMEKNSGGGEGGASPFKLLASREVYQNPWIAVREDRVIRPGGREGIFGVVRMMPGSSVLAVTADGNALLAREFKYAIGRPSLEVVSGGLDDRESPLEAAKRELREELGLTANLWVDLGRLDPFTTVVDSPNYMFLATNLEESAKRPDSGELIEIVKVPFEVALEMVLKGEITHGASCTAILKAHVHFNRAR